MLVSALGATLVGFALLVLALATGTLWLAVACIVICVAGALLLLADTLGFRPSLPRRSRNPAAGDEEAPTGADTDAPTEQFDRITGDAVVTLGDDEPATDVGPRTTDSATAPSGHGRHERPDLGDGAAEGAADDGATVDSPRRGRHGTPE